MGNLWSQPDCLLINWELIKIKRPHGKIGRPSTTYQGRAPPLAPWTDYNSTATYWGGVVFLCADIRVECLPSSWHPRWHKILRPHRNIFQNYRTFFAVFGQNKISCCNITFSDTRITFLSPKDFLRQHKISCHKNSKKVFPFKERQFLSKEKAWVAVEKIHFLWQE